jgi:hypothetical protein
MFRREGYTDNRGRWTAKPILFPDARTFHDIFSEARLAEGMPRINPDDDTCWRYVCATSARRAAPIGHMGGKHYLRTRKDGSFSCFGRAGARFMSPHARPLPGVVRKAEESMISAAGSFEVIDRTDGVLITLRDNNGIGTRWIALLDPGESLIPLMSQADQDAWAHHLAREADVRSIVDGGTVNTGRAEAFGVEIRVDEY